MAGAVAGAMRALGIGAALAVLPFAWNGAVASTDTELIDVQVEISATCIVSGATTLNIGARGVLSDKVNAASTITVSCTNKTPYSIGLDEGVNGLSVIDRQMRFGRRRVHRLCFVQ